MIGEVDQARSLFRGEQPLLDHKRDMRV